MKRTNVYLSNKQLERLRERSAREGVAVAELVRRAIDSFLRKMTQCMATGRFHPVPWNGTGLLTPIDKA